MMSIKAVLRVPTVFSLDVFEARCDARALLCCEGMIDLHLAVDELQDAAEQGGLVKDIGQDAVQAIMSQSFRRWRQEC